MHWRVTEWARPRPNVFQTEGSQIGDRRLSTSCGVARYYCGDDLVDYWTCQRLNKGLIGCIFDHLGHHNWMWCRNMSQYISSFWPSLCLKLCLALRAALPVKTQNFSVSCITAARTLFSTQPFAFVQYSMSQKMLHFNNLDYTYCRNS